MSMAQRQLVRDSIFFALSYGVIVIAVIFG
ncbi:hypothetical protein QOZ94_002252 [Xanthobacter agilis]|uniref:Uncharacterized protein n=1 Tax=Xanthobacter agilis TaxID=47492 RepID=A0ABU0LE94_XANAG|nr:hypothetical protein [Xanthobacter agilis]